LSDPGVESLRTARQNRARSEP